MTLDVILVTWNSARHITGCLDSLIEAKCGGFKLRRVFIVDNGSSDETVPIAKTFCSRLPIELIENEANLGFARACNLAAARSAADLMLFLNPDTRLFADSLEKAATALNRPDMTRVAVCGVQLMDKAGVPTYSVARFPQGRTFLYKALGLSALLPAIFPASLLPGGTPAQSGYVDQVIGAFFPYQTQRICRRRWLR